MLSACCNSTTLPCHTHLSFASLDTMGDMIAVSYGSQYTTYTVAGTDESDAGDATELKWEFDKDLGRYYVSFPDDQ